MDNTDNITMKASVIILNWNGANMLRTYLPSVVKYTQKADCEVVVADNGSTDDSIELIKNDFPSVRLVCFDKNYGFAEGYNKALEHTTAQYSVLLNSDVMVTENWLEPMLNYLDEHTDVAACQPKVLSHKSYEQHLLTGEPVMFEHAGASGGYMDILGYPFCRGRIMDYVEADNGQYDDITDIFWATGACLCIRTDVYKKEGGLDADFFAHMEEIDLCWRLLSRGYRLVCIPSSTIYHLGGGALSYENPRKTYLNFRNNLLLLYKNSPTSRLLWLMPIRCILDYVAALQFLLSGKRKNAKAVVDARFAYLKLRRYYKPKRVDNLRNSQHTDNQYISKRCIIFDYYVLRKRK